jgi:hypothetical protein
MYHNAFEAEQNILGIMLTRVLGGIEDMGSKIDNLLNGLRRSLLKLFDMVKFCINW